MKRFLLRFLVALVIFVLAVAAFVFVRSELALRKTWSVGESALVVPDTADAVAHGEHLAITRGCADCHAKDLGGAIVMDAPAIGRMSAPNLTRGRGSVVAGFRPEDWERAVRHGVKPDGHALLFMPIRDYAGLADADMADLIAYLRQLPPVDRESPPSYVGPVGRALFAFGIMTMIEARAIDQAAPHPQRMDAAATVEYGHYLAQSCTGCHGEHFSGGRIPGAPPEFPAPPNLTPDTETGIGGWTKADFYRVFREGKKPDGSTLDPFMPWQSLGQLTDTELDALWLFLRTVPARAQGQR